MWDILVAMMNSKEITEKYHAVVALDTLTKQGKFYFFLLTIRDIGNNFAEEDIQRACSLNYQVRKF